MPKFVLFSEISEKQYASYIAEWEAAGEPIVPLASSPRDMTYESLQGFWLEDTKEIAYEKGFVPSSLYFLVDENHKILGSAHIRHDLNDRLKLFGGHIGYGVRPSERGNGYAKELLKQSLIVARAVGVQQARLSCDDTNIPSAKTIEACGGKLVDKIRVEDALIRRYVIEI